MGGIKGKTQRLDIKKLPKKFGDIKYHTAVLHRNGIDNLNIK